MYTLHTCTFWWKTHTQYRKNAVWHSHSQCSYSVWLGKVATCTTFYNYTCIKSDIFTMHTVLFVTEGVQERTVTLGEQAQFSCSVVGSEVDIEWIIDDSRFERCPALGDTDICFTNSYMSDTATTRSTLIITDSSSLGVGDHSLQCIVTQDSVGINLSSRIAFLHVLSTTSEFYSLSLYTCMWWCEPCLLCTTTLCCLWRCRFLQCIKNVCVACKILWQSFCMWTLLVQLKSKSHYAHYTKQTHYTS